MGQYEKPHVTGQEKFMSVREKGISITVLETRSAFKLLPVKTFGKRAEVVSGISEANSFPHETTGKTKRKLKGN